MIDFSFVTAPTTGQIQQIAGLYRAAGWWEEAPVHLGKVGRIITGSHCFMVASRSDEIIGMGRALSDGASDAYIQDVTVIQAFQNRGIGTRIVTAITERLRGDGLDWIGLVAEKGSHEFYRHMGFKQMPGAVPMLMISP